MNRQSDDQKRILLALWEVADSFEADTRRLARRSKWLMQQVLGNDVEELR